MTCIRCRHTEARKFGRYGKRRIQRYRCPSCKVTFSEYEPKLGNHYTDPETATKVLTLMLEGMSVRAISRFTGMDKLTILSLMMTAAERAKKVLDKHVQNITPRFVQVDELWAFIHTKEQNLYTGDPKTWGSIYLWLGLDSETKLIISHHLGDRNTVNAWKMILDLRKRTLGRYQITTDALNSYVSAIREWYGTDVDFAQLRKIYGKGHSEGWYGSGRILGAVPHVKIGTPDWTRISTSHVERANLSVRMHMRRFTR